MVDIGIFESLQHVFGKASELVFRQFECRQQFVEHDLMDVFPDEFIVACISDDIDTGEECYRRENGMRTVEQCRLAQMIGSFVVGEHHVESCFACGPLLVKLFDGDVLVVFDDPEVEDLALHHRSVLVADTLPQLLFVVAGIAVDDAVDECGADRAAVGYPFAESLSFVEVFVPQVDVLVDALFEVMSIAEDQLTGQDDESLLGVAVETSVAAIEQLREFGRIGGGRCVAQFARIVEGDTGLGGVGDDKAHLGLLGQSHECVVLCIGIQRAADAADTLAGVYLLVAFQSEQVDMVEAVLCAQRLDMVALAWLYDDDRAIESRLVVHFLDHPVHKCSEEVALTKLYHTLRSLSFRCRVSVENVVSHRFSIYNKV